MNLDEGPSAGFVGSEGDAIESGSDMSDSEDDGDDSHEEDDSDDDDDDEAPEEESMGKGREEAQKEDEKRRLALEKYVLLSSFLGARRNGTRHIC